MGIISKEMKDQVISKYPPLYHELLQKQILAIEDTITTYMLNYQHSQDFRKAIDIVLLDILNGKYLGVDINDN
jgi:hypothetical protein